MRTITITTPGPQGVQGEVGPQGDSVFSSLTPGVWSTTASIQVSGSFTVSGSSTFTNIGPAVFSGNVNTSGITTMASAIVSGDVQVLGTASISVLQINTTINSTGSNALGDNANDTQTLYGMVVIPTGSLIVSGTSQFTGNINFPNQYQYIGMGVSDAIRFANGEVRVSTSTTTGNFSVYAPSYGLTAFRVMANGNTLVGTTDNPGYKLHVSGSGNFNNDLTVTGSLTMGGSIFTAGYIGYPNNSRYLQFNDADGLVRLQGFSGIRLMTYNTTAYTDVVRIDGNVTTRTVQVSGSLRTSGSITIQGPDRTLYTQAVTNTTPDSYIYIGDSSRVGSTGGSNIYYASGYYSQAAHQFYGGTATNMTSVVDIYGGQSGKPALRVSGSTQLTGSLIMSSSNAIRFNDTGSGVSATYGDLSIFRYPTYDTPALKVARPDGIGFTLYRQGSTSNFWVGDENGNRNIAMYASTFGAFSLTAPGVGGDLAFTGGSPTNQQYASSMVFSTFDTATTAATSSDHAFKFNGPNITGSNPYNMVSFQASAVEKAAIRYDGGAYFSSSVGIGTGSALYKLDVLSSDSLSFRARSSNHTLYVGDGIYHTGYHYHFAQANTDQFVISMEGGSTSTNFGVGLNSLNIVPLAYRQSYNYDTSSLSNSPAFRIFSGDAPAANDKKWIGQYYTSSVGYLTVGTGSLSINPAGNFVGIGTSAPAYTLDVNGTAMIRSTFDVNRSDGTKLLNINDSAAVFDWNPNNTSVPTFRIRGNATTVLLHIKSSEDRIGMGTLSPVASAMLDITSTTKGFLPPRMTNAQRTAISTPAVGLMVYCTDATEGLYVYKSTGWTFIV